MTPITLKELKELVSPTRGQKLPTAKALRESEGEIIAEASIGMDAMLRVYKSGFYSYETPSGTTVYAVDRLDGYRYENGDVMDKDVLEGMEWTVSLALAGEDRLEHNQQQRESTYSYSHDAVEGNDLRNPVDFTTALVDRDLVDKMMGVLTEKQREVVHLRFERCMNYEQIASAMGIQKQVVYRHLQAAMERIKKSATFF